MHYHLNDLKLFTIHIKTEIISPRNKEQFINLVKSKTQILKQSKKWLRSHSFTLGLSYKVVRE